MFPYDTFCTNFRYFILMKDYWFYLKALFWFIWYLQQRYDIYEWCIMTLLLLFFVRVVYTYSIHERKKFSVNGLFLSVLLLL